MNSLKNADEIVDKVGFQDMCLTINFQYMPYDSKMHIKLLRGSISFFAAVGDGQVFTAITHWLN